MADNPTAKIEAARPTVMKAVDELKQQGFTPDEIAEAVTVVGLDLGMATHGPRATARVLYLTALALTKQADEEEKQPKH